MSDQYVSGVVGPAEIVDATKRMYSARTAYKNYHFGKRIKILTNFFCIWWDYDATLGSAIAYEETSRVLKFYGINLG
jgi:hypothetical protein